MKGLYESSLTSLEPIGRGKVRDLYALDEDHMLVVTTDRISAFDVILPQPIPGKGEVLSRLSRFWFGRTKGLIPNHLSDLPLEGVLTDPDERARLGDRAQVVRRLNPLPVEAIVRGYIIGSAWKDYTRDGRVCGIALPAGLRLADALPAPIFTPSTKAALGEHDENIDMARMVELVGAETAERIRDISLAIYRQCADYALSRGLIIADTKLEFGLDREGELHLIDEVLTPDSSRFWPADAYQPGVNPPSFDKQFVRDYLEGLAWNKEPPAPDLPAHIVERTAEKYREAEARLVQP